MKARRPNVEGADGALRSKTEHGVPVGYGLILLTVVAALGGAVAGAQPTGSGPLDALWSAGFSAVLVLAASRSRRLPTTVLGGIAGAVGVGGDPATTVLGVLSLVGSGYLALSRTRERLVGALVGLLSGQALLRGPSYGFAGLPTIVAAVAVVPVLISAWRIARSRERRIARLTLVAIGAVVIFGTATAAVAAYQSRSHLNTASDQAEVGLDLLRSGDTEAAADAFSKSQYQFEKASAQVDGPLGLVGRVVPVVAQNLEAVRRASSSGADIGFTASQAATTADWRELTATDGTVDLEKLATMQGPVTTSAEALRRALATVADIRSPWLVPPLADQLDELDQRLTSAADEAETASEGLRVVPSLLGSDQVRRYLVVFTTPGESRNAGGFAGAYAVIEADHGALSILRTGSTMDELPVAPGSEPLDLPPSWEDLYGSFEVGRFPGNITASPDWPTDAQVGADVYERSAEGGPVDGVIYADPTALASLLELTGPVEVDGVAEPLTAENAEQYLFVDQYVQYERAGFERREVLGDVAQAVFDALTSRPLPGISELTEVLGPAVSGGHLRITAINQDDAQRFLDRTGISGRFGADPSADLLSLRSSNLVASKIDAFLRREVSTSISIDPATGAIATEVVVTLHNDAPTDGLPDYIIGDGTLVPRGTNRDLLSLFTPLELSSVLVDGAAVPVQSQRELDLNVYAVPVDIAPGESVEVSYHLAGPPPAGLQETGEYTVLIVPQPLVTPDRWNVRIQVGDDPPRTEEETLTSPLKVTVPVVEGD